MVLGGVDYAHYGQFRVPFRVNQVPLVALGLKQVKRLDQGLTGSSRVL